MCQFSEFAKLLTVLRFLISSILDVILKNDSDAKRLITNLYLMAISKKSHIPSKVVSINDFDTYKISAYLYKDMNALMKDRFVLMETNDLLPLLSLLYYCKPKKIFEFGLMKGGSLTHFFLNTSSEVTIDSIDIDFNNLNPVAKKLIAENARIRLHNKNSLHFDTEPFSGQMDFIFIDGGHDYEIVKNDTQKALEMLSPKGMIVWDDYNLDFPGVFACVNELPSSKRMSFI